MQKNLSHQSEASRARWPRHTEASCEGLARHSVASGEGWPKHVALMLDGNRRWAKKNGLPPYRGHYQGAKTLKSLIEALSGTKGPGVEFLTFWGGSLSNFSRPKKEVRVLFDVYGKYFAMLARRKELREHGIRVRIIGDWQKIVPDKVSKIFNGIIEKTAKHDKINLTFLIVYDGKEEMRSAINQIANRKLRDKNLKVTEDLIKKSLWTGDLPPVDLMIRTGVENDPHWSAGFMMWLCAESQFYFTKTLWPDFSVKEFEKALRIYAKIQRRFGR